MTTVTKITIANTMGAHFGILSFICFSSRMVLPDATGLATTGGFPATGGSLPPPALVWTQFGESVIESRRFHLLYCADILLCTRRTARCRRRQLRRPHVHDKNDEGKQNEPRPHLLLFHIFSSVVFPNEFTRGCSANDIHVPARNRIGNRLGFGGVLVEILLRHFPFLRRTLAGERGGRREKGGAKVRTAVPCTVATACADIVRTTVADRESHRLVAEIGVGGVARRTRGNVHGRRGRTGSPRSHASVLWTPERKRIRTGQATETAPTVPMDPRPTLDVVNLDSPRRLQRHRRRAMKVVIPREEKKLASRVVSRYRRQQRRLLGEKDSDPDPYDSDYVFYCLEGPRED